MAAQHWIARVAVMAQGSQGRWLADWCASLEPRQGITLVPVAPAVDPHADAASQLASHAQAPFDRVVLLIAADSQAWAQAALRSLVAAGLRVLVVSRSVGAAALRQMLALGAQDFAADGDRDELRLRLWRLCAGVAPKAAPCSGAAAPRHPKLARLVGSSPAFARLIDRVPVMAGCDAGVLLLGETGTGKELFAQAVHYLSPRAGHPWVAVNCGALPADLVEAELFGHVRGAFTHAVESRAGLVAQAQGGTLFLDEIDSLPAAAQVKLLRFLQDKEYRAVGSTRTQHADVRIIAASNDDLGRLAAAGGFRPDLYYRLNVLALTLPPLRERGDDALALAQHFVERYALEFDREVTGLSAEARERIAAYRWPGNIRELQHAVERGVLLAPAAEVLAGDLGIEGADGDGGAQRQAESFRAAKARAVERFERGYLERMLGRCGGNITRAADAASKNRRAFWQLMRKHGIDSAKFRNEA